MFRKFGTVAIILMALAAITLFIFCSSGSDKMPITTSSDEALQKFLKGRELQEQFAIIESADFLEDAIKIDSQFAMAYLLLAFTKSSTEEYFECFNTAVALKPIVSEAERLLIGSIEARMLGKTGEQQILLDELVEIFPKDERAHMALANYYFTQQDYERAIKEYERCTQLNYRFTLPYNMLGYCYRDLGNYEKAEESFEKYIKLNPNQPNPYDSYGELKMRMGKYGESIESYNKALKIDPTFTPSHLGIATNLNFLGKHKDARDQLHEYYSIADNDDDRKTALLGIAVSYVDEGKFTDGIKILEDRIELSRRTNDLIAMMADSRLIANLYIELDQPDNAEKYYNDAINLIDSSNLSDELKENSTRDRSYLRGRIALARNDVKTAKEELQKYQQVAKANASILRTRAMHELAGIIALHEKKYEEALEQLQLGREQSAYNKYRIGLAYEKMGDTDSAIKMYEKAVKFNSVNDLNYAMIRMKAIKKVKSLQSQH